MAESIEGAARQSQFGPVICEEFYAQIREHLARGESVRITHGGNEMMTLHPNGTISYAEPGCRVVCHPPRTI